MFKKNYSCFVLSAFIAISHVSCLSAMELSPEEQAKRKSSESVAITPQTDPVKRVKLTDVKTLKSLPVDVLVKILMSVDTPAQAVKNIKSLMRTEKYFYDLLSNDTGNKVLLEALARKFFHHDQFQAAKVLDTAASRRWVSTAINPDVQKNLQAILTANGPAISNGNLTSVRNFLGSKPGKSEETIENKFFSSPAARIWLIKKLLEYALNKQLMLTGIREKLFPQTTSDPELDEWIQFVQSSLNSKIGELVRQGNSADLKRLMNQGIDLSQNFSTGTSYLFHAKDSPTLKILIAAGADINTIQPKTGNSALHIIISEINDQSIIQGASLSNPENQDVTLKIRALLEAGANPNIKNAYQQTPLALVKEKMNLARRYKRPDDIFLLSLERLLKKYGATE